jgi:hypothetical protein
VVFKVKSMPGLASHSHNAMLLQKSGRSLIAELRNFFGTYQAYSIYRGLVSASGATNIALTLTLTLTLSASMSTPCTTSMSTPCPLSLSMVLPYWQL